jgi:hypothetical protein
MKLWRRTAHQALALALVATAAGASLVSDRASASPWTRSELVLPTSRPVIAPAIEAGPGRYAVVVWRSGRSVGEAGRGPGPTLSFADSAAGPLSGGLTPGRIFASVRDIDGRHFSTPVAISPANPISWALGMSADGQTVVAWSDPSGRIQVRQRSPSSNWGPIETIVGPGDRFLAGLRVAHDGGAVLGWYEGAEILASVRPPGGSFGAPQLVGLDFNQAPATFGQGAMGAGGRGLIVLGGECPLDHPAAHKDARAWLLEPPSTSWSPSQVIPNTKCPNAGGQAAIDKSGEAVVIVNGYLIYGRIKASVRPPGGQFAPAQLISRPKEAHDASLGMDRFGRAIVAWGVSERGVFGSARPRGGSFSAPRRISGRKATKGELTIRNGQLAVSAGGAALVPMVRLRSRRDPSFPFRLEAAYMRPRGWFGKPERVLGWRRGDEIPFVDAAVRKGGRALLAWTRSRRGYTYGVFVAKRAPNCRGVEATLIGRPGIRVLRGKARRREVIVSRRRAHRILARGGNDLICAGAGNDVIRTGRGNNVILAGHGNDHIIARAPGRNRIFARKGRNLIRCGPGRDVVFTNRVSKVDETCDRVVRKSPR